MNHSDSLHGKSPFAEASVLRSQSHTATVEIMTSKTGLRLNAVNWDDNGRLSQVLYVCTRSRRDPKRPSIRSQCPYAKSKTAAALTCQMLMSESRQVAHRLRLTSWTVIGPGLCCFSSRHFACRPSSRFPTLTSSRGRHQWSRVRHENLSTGCLHHELAQRQVKASNAEKTQLTTIIVGVDTSCDMPKSF